MLILTRLRETFETGMHAKLAIMNLTGKITTAACVLVVGGLVALAVPALTSAVGELSDWALFASTPEQPVQTAADLTPTPEPTAEPITDRTHGDCALLYYPDGGISPALDAPVDTGARPFAEGPVELVDGIPTLYTVAPGDAINAIGTRFCTFSTGIFYFNDVQLQGTIQPGDVLRLR